MAKVLFAWRRTGKMIETGDQNMIFELEKDIKPGANLTKCAGFC